MKAKTIIAGFLTCTILTGSCAKNELEDNNAPTDQTGEEGNTTGSDIIIEGEENLSPVISQDGGVSTISFTAKKSWTASVTDIKSTEDWLSISPTSGEAGDITLSISAERNDSPDERTKNILIDAGDSQVTVSVIQKQRDALTVSPQHRTIEAGECEFEIIVKANIEYTVDIQADWIHSIQTRGMTTNHLRFSAESNPGQERTGTIVIRSNELSETLTITQEKGELHTDTDQIVIDAFNQSISLNFETNMDFSLKTDANWLHTASTKLTLYTAYIQADENMTGKSRHADIVIMSDTGLSETITVTQDAVGIRVSAEDFNMEGGKCTISYAGAISDFKATSEDPWIALESENEQDRQYTFSIQANNQSKETRKGKFTITYNLDGKQEEQIKHITQAGNPDALDKYVYNIDANGGNITINAPQKYYNILNGSDWIHYTSDNNGQFEFSIDKNNTGSQREGIIEFVENEICEKIRIIQSGEEVTNCNIADQAFLEYLIRYHDTNNDGFFSEEEAANIETLNIDYSDLMTLTEFQCFTSLKEFRCIASENKSLTTINISNCKSLEKFVYYRGTIFPPQGEGDHNTLTTLNLSGCTNLKFISCRVARLTTLDISGCSNLYSLNCEYNHLSNIDLSECHNLSSLNCSFNDITDIDLSECPNLSSLNCSYNDITGIDLSGCPNLSSLNCSGNWLITDIDLSKCPNLYSLSCGGTNISKLNVSGFTRLHDLDISVSRSLSELNISKCSNLESINAHYCDSLSVVNANGCLKLGVLPINAKSLTYIDISKCPFKSFEFSHNSLIELYASECNKLESLDCSYNSLKKLDLTGCQNLSVLSCNHNSLSRLDVSKCPALSNLNCVYNSLTSLDVSQCPALSYLDCRNNPLKTLYLSQNNQPENMYYPNGCKIIYVE